MSEGIAVLAHDQPPPAPLAKVRGELLTELPHDLYIPPDALAVYLETFEGPLDLLLYLIRRHSLDILDIPMAELTRQYMGYIDMMHTRHLELAAEYLLMAAVLIDIKSRMLLPRPPAETDGADELDPRAELMRRLIEYEQIKLAAQALDALPHVERDFVRVTVMVEQTVGLALPEVHPDELRDAWLAVLARARLNQHHRVGREGLSVRERMTRVLRRLREAQGRMVRFAELFDAEAGVPEVVVTLLAVLELTKEMLVNILQSEPFAQIHVRLADAAAAEQ